MKPVDLPALKWNQTACPECGALYRKPSQAIYCARQDLDPRQENEHLHTGLMAATWIVKPGGAR